MKIFQYTITLIDPLFYSQEGLSGAVCPSCIHATAINHAILYALGKGENQPYLISEDNGGRNIPRYKNSMISKEFYLSPSRLIKAPQYVSEIVKGELDGFVAKGYPGAEVLRASQIFSLAPESMFQGYGIYKDDVMLPEIIRLGSFRGKAKLALHPAMTVKMVSNLLVDHIVDPLVTKVSRGIMINIFPYPIIENGICSNCLEIRIEGKRYKKIISLPDEILKEATEGDELIKGDSIIF